MKNCCTGIGFIRDRFIIRENARDPAAENHAIANRNDSMRVVVKKRLLGLASDDDKSFKDGGVYKVGFAVLDDDIVIRGRHISFLGILAIGAGADSQAVKLP